MFILYSYCKHHIAYLRIFILLLMSMFIVSINYIDQNNTKVDKFIEYNGNIKNVLIVNNDKQYKGQLNITYKNKECTYIQDITDFTTLNDVMLRLKFYSIGQEINVYTDLQGTNPNIQNVFGTTYDKEYKKKALIILYILFCVISISFLPLISIIRTENKNGVLEFINNMLYIFCMSYSFYNPYPSYLLLQITMCFRFYFIYKELKDYVYLFLLGLYTVGMSFILFYYKTDIASDLVLYCYTSLHIVYMFFYILFTYKERWDIYINEQHQLNSIRVIQISHPIDTEDTPPDIIKKIKCMMCSKESMWNVNSPPSYTINMEECIVCTDKKPLVYLQECGHTVSCKECLIKLSEG